MNLASFVALRGRYRADHPAIESDAGILTYGALDEQAARMSAGLGAAGIGQGDLVGVLLRDTPEHLVAMLAVMRRGAAVLAMDWRWTAAETERMVTRFAPRAVIVEEGQEIAGDAPAVGVETLAASAPDPAPPVSLDDAPLFHGITSGTTGEPGVVVISHAEMFARFASFWTDYPQLRDDRHLLTLPLAYAGGRGVALSHLCLGATVVLFPSLIEPAELVRIVEDRRITTMNATPNLSRELLRMPRHRGGLLLGGLRLYMSSTAGIHAEEKAAIRAGVAPAMLELYASMAGGLVSVLPDADMTRAAASVGRPVLGVEIDIADDEGRPLPLGEIGRLRHRGPGVAARFVAAGAEGQEGNRDGWYYPGDLARIDADGFIYLQGRTTEVIKRAGTTIYATEIEGVLLAHPAIAEAAVVGAPSRELGEEVVAFVVLGTPVEPKTLAVYCRRQLASFKVPRQLIVIESLPRNASGKVVKAKLLEHFE